MPTRDSHFPTAMAGAIPATAHRSIRSCACRRRSWWWGTSFSENKRFEWTWPLGADGFQVTRGDVAAMAAGDDGICIASDVVAQVYPGETVEILGDSAAVDGLAWWRVRYVGRDGAVVEGWIAEATAGGVQILGE